MGNTGLRMFALGMNSEVESLGKLALGTEFGNMGAFPTMGTDFGQDFRPPTEAAVPPPAQMPQQPQFGADDPSAMFGSLEQQYGLPSGTLMHLYGLESSYGQNLANPRSSARGPFQFINSTAKQYGLDANSVMQLGPSAKAAAQMGGANKARLAKALGREPTIGELYLAHQQGGAGAVGLLTKPNEKAANIVGLPAVIQNGGDENMTAGEFASLWTNKVPGKATMSARGSTPPFFPGSKLDVDTSALEEDMEDMSPEALKRRHQGAMLMGIGQGISQIARGESPDMSNVMDSYYNRQTEARRRLMEISMERRRQQEYNQNHEWDVEGDYRADAMQQASEERAVQRQIEAEQRGEAATIRSEGRSEAATIRGEERGEAADIRQEGRTDTRQIAAEGRAEEATIRGEGRGEATTIRAEDREAARLEEQASQAQSLYEDIVPNAGDYFRVGGMDAVKDAATRRQTIADRARTAQSMRSLADANPENTVYQSVANAMEADPSLSFKDAYELFKGDDPAAVKEFKFMKGLSDTGQREYLDFKSRGGATFNMGDTVATLGAKSAFEELGKDRDVLRSEQPAYQAYQLLQDLFEAYPDGRLPSGALEDLTLDARRYLSDMGVLGPKGDLKVGLQMAVNSLGSRLIGAVRVPGTGSTSDLEFSEFKKSIPNTAKPEVVNHIMNQVGLNNYRYKEQLTNMKEAYINQHGNTVGFDKEVGKAMQDGSLQATIYSIENLSAMKNAISAGNLNAGDVIKGPNGQFMVMTEEGIDQLLSGGQ